MRVCVCDTNLPLTFVILRINSSMTLRFRYMACDVIRQNEVSMHTG